MKTIFGFRVLTSLLANMKGTNVPGLRRLKQFFDDKN